MKLPKILFAMLIVATLVTLTACGGGGSVPYIGENGNWWIDSLDLGVSARGQQGKDGAQGPQGEKGETGEKGEDGADGAAGPVGPVGPAGQQGSKGDKGDAGANGLTPYIGDNGNWWIGDTDTGIFVGGRVEACSDGLSFTFETMNGKAGAVLTGYSGSDRDVVIPNCFANMPVIGMKDSAFAGNKYITSVRLSANMTALSKAAFKNCTSLKRVDFNNAKITVIPESAFENTAIEEMILPPGIKSVEASAFSSVSNVFVYIPSSVTEISDSFSSSAHLVFESETLPQGMQNSATKPLTYSLGVPGESVFYDEAQGMYLCREGNGYSLLSYVSDASGILTLPSHYNSYPILRIRAYAVRCSSAVMDIVIGSATECLDANAIVADGALRSIYLPASVKTAEKNAIQGSPEICFFGASTLPVGFDAGFCENFSSAQALYAVTPGVLCETEDYLYISHAGTVTLLRFKGNKDTLEIPETLGGKSVTAIKSGFFEGYYTRKITIPATVVTVEKHAFHFTPYTSGSGVRKYYSAEFYFAILDPFYNNCAYDYDFILVDPQDTTPKTVYFGGESVKQTYPGFDKNVF